MTCRFRLRSDVVVTMRSGQVSAVEDKRTLETLASDLCQNGYVVVRRLGGGYAPALSEIALLERTVARIEPVP